jgi:hypothetical protein
VLASERILHTIVNARDFLVCTAKQRTVRTALKKVINHVDFVKTAELCIAILTPIDVLIKMFQSDKVPLSVVYFKLDTLAAQFKDIRGLSEHANAPRLYYIEQLVVYRWGFVYSEAHGMSYLLSPVMVNNDHVIDEDHRERTVRVLCKYPVNGVRATPEQELDMYQQYVLFVTFARRQKANNDIAYKALHAEVNPMPEAKWWEVNFVLY